MKLTKTSIVNTMKKMTENNILILIIGIQYENNTQQCERNCIQDIDIRLQKTIITTSILNLLQKTVSIPESS
jgi:hypothetical protein